MGTPLQSVLQARYQNPTDIGSKTYGGEEIGSPCLASEKIENYPLLPINTVDVSRTSILYFPESVYLGGNAEGISGGIENGNLNKQAINRAVNFLNKPYVLIGSGIYEYDKGSSTWSVSLQLTGKLSTESNSIGLYPIVEVGVPKLLTAWNTTSSNWRFAKLNGNTNVWTISSETAVVDPSDANGGILNEIQHGDRIYFIDSGTSSIYYFDYILERFGSISWGDTIRHPIDFASYRNKLYALGKDADTTFPNGKIRLHRIDLTGTTSVGTFPSSAGPLGTPISASNIYEGRNLLFVDNVFNVDAHNYDPSISGVPVLRAYNAVVGSSSNGLATYAWVELPDGSLSGLANTAPLTRGAFPSNPFKMMTNQEGAGGGPFPQDAQKQEHTVLRIFHDQKKRDVDLSDQTNIACSARYSVGCDSDNTGGGDLTNLHYFEWEGVNDDQVLSDGGEHAFKFLGFPGKQSYHRAFVHEKRGGGSRYWELTGDGDTIPDIVYSRMTPTTQNGVMRIFYNLATSEASPSGTNVNVRWFFDKYAHAPEAACTLVGTSDGALSGNLAINITLEDREYWVDWDAMGDEANRDRKASLNGQVGTSLSASAAINDPTDLASLALWLEANDETTISSGIDGSISEWRDKSGGLVSGVLQSTHLLKPTFIPNANNGNGGVSFISASGHYLFASGSPVNAGSVTMLVVYEPTAAVGRQTLFSLSNDEPVNTFTDANYLGMYASGSEYAIGISSQDDVHRTASDAPRELSIASGASLNKTKLSTWRELQFQVSLEYAPTGINSLGEKTEFFAADETENYEPSGLSNVTIGRFSGSSLSGVYTSAGEYFDGTIYEVAIYDRSLYDIEVERFKKYVENKYTLDF